MTSLSKPDLLSENLIHLIEAGQHFPGRPGRLSLWRYANRGVRGADGQLHVLETIKSSNKRWTSLQAIQRFLTATNRPKAASQEQTPHQRSKQKQSAKNVLEAMGVL